jgi:hypothetical protein
MSSNRSSSSGPSSVRERAEALCALVRQPPNGWDASRTKSSTPFCTRACFQSFCRSQLAAWAGRDAISSKPPRRGGARTAQPGGASPMQYDELRGLAWTERRRPDRGFRARTFSVLVGFGSQRRIDRNGRGISRLRKLDLWFGQFVRPMGVGHFDVEGRRGAQHLLGVSRPEGRCRTPGRHLGHPGFAGDLQRRLGFRAPRFTPLAADWREACRADRGHARCAGGLHPSVRRRDRDR